MAWPVTVQMTFGIWMFHSDQNNIECVCVSTTASKGQTKFVYGCTKVITKKYFKRKLRISGGQKRPTLLWILITGKEISLYIQWRRFTFGKHFVPKLYRQKRNRSSEDSWSKGKLRIIEGPLKPRKAWQDLWKVHVLPKKLAATNKCCSDDQRSIQWLLLMEKHLKLLFNQRKMWGCLLRIACGLQNTSLTVNVVLKLWI